MLTLLRSLIQPRLDYCSQLWSPRDQTSINKIEAVQRQFISQIRGYELTGMNYWEKLSFLRVYSQERRRERYQICFLWKQSQGLVDGYQFKWHLVHQFVVPGAFGPKPGFGLGLVNSCLFMKND